MNRKVDLIGRRVGTLTVERDLGDDQFHCVCDCGRYRTVSRNRLVGKDIESCHVCAAENRRHRLRPAPPPPEPKPARIEPPKCTGQRRGGWLLCSPDCPRHAITRPYERRYAEAM